MRPKTQPSKPLWERNGLNISRFKLFRRISYICICQAQGPPVGFRGVSLDPNYRGTTACPEDAPLKVNDIVLTPGRSRPSPQGSHHFDNPVAIWDHAAGPPKPLKGERDSKKLRPINRSVYTGEGPPSPGLVGDPAEAAGPEGRVSRELPRTICPNSGSKGDSMG